MEIGPDKTKVMTNNPNGFQREIKIKGQRLEEVENFKYLGAIISNEGSKPETLSRIAQTTASLSRLKIIWRDKNISLASKVKLMRMLILSTFLYASESWTLTAEIERRIQALEKILGHGEDNSAGDSERSKKERKTEEEMGRQHQGMDGSGLGDSLRAAEDREGWKGIVATSSVVPR